MTSPVVQLSLPDTDDERHFAPLQILLEGLTKINEFHLRDAAKRGQIFPPLYLSGVVYKEEAPGAEDWPDIPRIIANGWGDCVPMSSLVLRDDFETCEIGTLSPGDRIMGDGSWTTVMERCLTGEKELLAFGLSNGCVLRCTKEHRLFRDVAGRTEEIRAGEARIGDDLITPTQIPISGKTGASWPRSTIDLTDDERAWLLGVFIADGWTDSGGKDTGPYRVAISGLDGKPKEAQKRRVEALMTKTGVSTRWHEKYIAINDRDLAQMFAMQGHTAVNKHLASLGFASESEVRSVIDGLAADASARSGVFSTISPKLALQLRVLHRMIGQSVHIARHDEHGGFGKHPIYQITPRTAYAERRHLKFARIRSIADGGSEMCADITTDTGKFWLPESDVVVHNCEDLAAWRAAELRVAGFDCEPVLKWQWIPRDQMLAAGYPAAHVPRKGVWLVHCLVRYPDGQIEDPSKILGMGGNFLERI